jgi:hypothetical protein
MLNFFVGCVARIKKFGFNKCFCALSGLEFSLLGPRGALQALLQVLGSPTFHLHIDLVINI